MKNKWIPPNIQNFQIPLGCSLNLFNKNSALQSVCVTVRFIMRQYSSVIWGWVQKLDCLDLNSRCHH